MKNTIWILTAVMALSLTACAGRDKKAAQYSPPSTGKVEQSLSEASAATTRATARAQTIKQTGAAPNAPIIIELLADLEATNAAHTKTLVELGAVKAEVTKQTESLNASNSEKNKALDRANYWQGKHTKALIELWFWRGLAILIVGGVVAFVVGKRVI